MQRDAVFAHLLKLSRSGQVRRRLKVRDCPASRDIWIPSSQTAGQTHCLLRMAGGYLTDRFDGFSCGLFGAVGKLGEP